MHAKKFVILPCSLQLKLYDYDPRILHRRILLFITYWALFQWLELWYAYISIFQLIIY